MDVATGWRPKDVPDGTYVKDDTEELEQLLCR